VFAEASVAAVFTSVPLPLMFTHGAFFKVPAGAGASNVLFLPTTAALPPPRLSMSSSLAPPLCDFPGPPF